MALTYSQIFGRLGRLLDHSTAVRAYQGTLDTEYADTVSNFGSGADMEWIGSLSRNLERRKEEATSTCDDLLTSATQYLIAATDANFILNRYDLTTALQELIRQMIISSQTVNGSTTSIGSTTAGSANVGNGTMKMSVMSPVLDPNNVRTGNIFTQTVKTETVTARCTTDSQSTSVDENAERFKVYGQRKLPRWDVDWPGGSGASFVQSAVNPRTDGSRSTGRNVGTNSDFENFTSNVPNHWTLETGTAGTQVFAAGAGYTGANALKFVGNGSVTCRLYQRFRVTSETLGQINPDKPYTISFAAKYAVAAPTASIRVSIEDASGNRLNSGVTYREMSATVTSGSLTTSYQLITNTCYSPITIPKGSRIVVESTSAIANTSQVFIDNVSVAQMRSMGPGLPAVQLIPGNIAFREGDEFSIVPTNTQGVVQREFDRFFDMQELNLALPGNTAGGETINDNVVS